MTLGLLTLKILEITSVFYKFYKFPTVFGWQVLKMD